LLPGHSLILKKGTLNIKRYWRLRFPQERKGLTRAYRARIPEVLKDTVKAHLVSDVPLGVFLSGGIDSSTIVALMHQLGIDSIKTFSIGYEQKYASYNELEYSRLIARKFNTQHQEFIITPDIIDTLPKVVGYLDEPFADSSAILTYFISREARKYVKVALSGVGGDEVFAGYPRYIGAKISLYYQHLPQFLRRSLVKVSGFIPESTSSTNVGGRAKRFLRAELLDEFDRYLNWLVFFNDHRKEELFVKDIKASLRTSTHDLIHKQAFKQCESKDYLDRISCVDFNTYLPYDLLVMADSMSMANSLELRVPFCDHQLIEFMASLPYSCRIKGLRLKGLLKDSLKGLLPPEVLHKPKKGFMIPIGDWIKAELKDYIFDLLNKESIRKRGIFNSDCIGELLKRHFSGEEVLTHQIWALLVLEVWFRNLYTEK
jgi:asparagine synthase (glutamine-hydrolysing)